MTMRLFPYSLFSYSFLFWLKLQIMDIRETCMYQLRLKFSSCAKTSLLVPKSVIEFNQRSRTRRRSISVYSYISISIYLYPHPSIHPSNCPSTIDYNELTYVIGAGKTSVKSLGQNPRIGRSRTNCNSQAWAITHRISFFVGKASALL